MSRKMLFSRWALLPLILQVGFEKVPNAKMWGPPPTLESRLSPIYCDTLPSIDLQVL